MNTITKLSSANRFAIIHWKQFHAAKRFAIINWKQFHAAKLYKKRIVRDGYGGCEKISFLSTEHYVILNALRGLPLDRGMSVEAYDRAYANLKRAIEADPRIRQHLLEKYAMPFGISDYWLGNFLKTVLI